MRSATTSSFTTLLRLGLVAATVSACGAFIGTEDAPPAPPADAPNSQPVADDDLTEKFGVFVSPAGTDDGDGSRQRPLARIQPAIDLAKRSAKRVYVCTGVYREALVLADAISVFGGLDCKDSGRWATGAPHARVEAPSSPALRAKDLGTATRIESLDVIAPAATSPGASSIVLIAERASALVFASSQLIAGDGAKGEDGADGVQLTNAATADGGAGAAAWNCTNTVTCQSATIHPSDVNGGTNACQGAPGFIAGAGGRGGAGGKWELILPPRNGVIQPPARLQVFNNDFSFDASPGDPSPTSAPGTEGKAGESAAATGTFSGEGYLPAQGGVGANGAVGEGGGGAPGLMPQGVTSLNSQVGDRWLGNKGSGGGAGGCPGLAGTAGKGGGASIGLLLIDSPVVLDATVVIAGRGGEAGHGSLGSAPTPGGAAGANPSGLAETAGKAGGRGGLAGVSSNGSSGPSLGVVHLGAAPQLVGATTIKPGAGGPPVPARSRTVLGATSTVPATPAGLAKEIHKL